MSVVGLDVGNDSSCVALARKRGIDVLMNKESKRETPAVVNFGDKMRFIGTDGAAKFSLSPQNTVHQLKRLVGKKFADPQLQLDISKLPFSVTEGPDGGCLINVTFCNEPASFTPEQIVAMILVDLKRIVEAEAGSLVSDCVIAVPTYFTGICLSLSKTALNCMNADHEWPCCAESERYAMLNASAIAGLNCLRLINENTATALAYGIYKTDLPGKISVVKCSNSENLP
jgi:heat shock protein 4